MAKAMIALAEGKRRMVFSVPTGCGKSILGLSMIAWAMRNGHRALWIAHRDELISQTVDSFERVAPDLAGRVGVVKAERDDADKQFVIASIQTLWGRDRAVEKERAALDAALDDCQPSEVDAIQAKLNALPPPSYPRWDALRPDSFKVVCYDECHHAMSRSAVALMKSVPKSAFFFGLSATPERGDRVGLEYLFTDGICYQLSLKEAIRKKLLVDYKYQSVWLDLDFSKIKNTAGDYNTKQLEDALEQAGVVSATVKGIQQFASDRKAVVFTLTIDQSKKTADALSELGFKAAHVSCETPDAERKKTLKDFSAGRIQFLCNAAVLTEGWDCPSCDCVVIARPSRSKGLYQQMVGRGLRTCEGKEDCLILDFCGSGSKNPPASVRDLTGILPQPGETSEQAERRELKEAEDQGLPQNVVAKAMLEAAERASALKKAFEASWVVLKSPPRGVVEGRVVAGSKGRKVIIWTTQPEAENGQRLWQVAVWMSAQEQGSVFWLEQKGVALDFAQNMGRQAMMDMNQNVLMQANAAWRQHPPTKGQIDFATKLSVAIGDGWNAGEVSNAVNAVMCSKDLAKLLSGRQTQLEFQTPESFKRALADERLAVDKELEDWRGRRDNKQNGVSA